MGSAVGDEFLLVAGGLGGIEGVEHGVGHKGVGITVDEEHG